MSNCEALATARTTEQPDPGVDDAKENRKRGKHTYRNPRGRPRAARQKSRNGRGGQKHEERCNPETVQSAKLTKSGIKLAHRPNEKEISHGRVSWQTRKTYFRMGPLASSTG